jgi:SAM pointed domain-containing ETS transcription factor
MVVSYEIEGVRGPWEGCILWYLFKYIYLFYYIINMCCFLLSLVDDPDRLPEESVQHHRQTIQLHQFLRNLLLDGHYTDCIRWVNRSEGVFKIENSARVAKLWGKRKNRPAMNYDKLSRSIRQYYKKNIIKKTENSKRLVYRFCKIEV